MVITIGAEKGGVAKTRLATNIAALAAASGADVVLLDTDRQGSAMSWVRIRNEENVVPSIPVFALPASPARELADLASRYDLVVVDIGAQNYRTMLECALLSDLVIVPCGADQQEVESTRAVFDALRDVGARRPDGKVPAFVALTRVSHLPSSRVTADLRAMFEIERINVFQACLPSREAWKACGKTGRAVHELRGKDRSGKAAAEMVALYQEIVEAGSKEVVSHD